MRAAIFTNGDYGDLDFYRKWFEKEGKIDIICADGGTNTVDKIGMMPTCIMGDLDSIENAILKKYKDLGVPIKKYSVHKDETDTELAVNYCLEKGYEEIIFFGALGSRLDHTLGNLYLLNRLLGAGIKSEVINATNRIMLTDRYLRLTLNVGDTVSIMAYTDTARGITLKGFEYPVLDGKMDHLMPGYGISNVALVRHPEIFVTQGTLLIDIVTE